MATRPAALSFALFTRDAQPRGLRAKPIGWRNRNPERGHQQKVRHSPRFVCTIFIRVRSFAYGARAASAGGGGLPSAAVLNRFPLAY